MKLRIVATSNMYKPIKELTKLTLPAQKQALLWDLVEEINKQSRKFSELRIKICEKYGTVNKEKEVYDILPENQEIFNKEINELINLEIELPWTLLNKKAFDAMIATSPDNIISGILIDKLKGIIWESEPEVASKEGDVK